MPITRQTGYLSIGIDMSKVGFRFRKGRIVISNKLTYPEEINEQVYMLVSNGLIENILPVFSKTVRRNTVLEGGIEGYVPLKDYLKDVISKKTFLKIVNIMIDTVKLCDSDGLSSVNLDLDMGRVLIRPETIEMKVVYWPVSNNRIAEPASVFFRKLGEAVMLPSAEDNGILDEYHKFFGGLEPFSLNMYEKMIAGFQGKKADSIVPEGEHQNSSEGTEMLAASVEYDPFRALDNTSSQPTADAVDEAACGDDESYLTAYIIRLADGSEVMIDREKFVMGSDVSCDYVITNNDHISRRHSVILFENDSFFITDLGSTNGTYLNDITIEPDLLYPLESGTKLRLADEYFEFEIREESL